MQAETRTECDIAHRVVLVDYIFTSVGAFLPSAHYGSNERLGYPRKVSECIAGGELLHALLDSIDLRYALGSLRIIRHMTANPVLLFVAVCQLT